MSYSYKILGKRPFPEILNQLKEKAPDLYEIVSRSKNEDGGFHLSQLLAQKLEAWLVAQEEPPKKSEWERFKEESAALAESEGKRIRDKREAVARLQQYADEQGLIDNEFNAGAITNFIATHPVLKGRASKAAVDIAINFLGPKGSNVLLWRHNLAEPPPAATPKPWKAGDSLPDNATEAMLRASTLAEVKAWKSRQQGK